MGQNAKIDRRKIIYRGKEINMDTQVHGLIQFDIKTNRQECAQCNKTAATQDKGGLTQHAVKHKNKQYL